MSNEVAKSSSVIVRVANRYGVDPAKLLATLKATVWKSDKSLSDEQLLMLLVIADTYKLNPLLREIHAIPDKQGGIIPIVGVDGFIKLAQNNSAFDGMEFEEAADGSSCTCIVHRKDRGHPVKVTEYLAECRRNTGPWVSHPRRMLRHRSMVQALRIAFGYAAIFDPDEAAAIAAGPDTTAEGYRYASPDDLVKRAKTASAEADAELKALDRQLAEDAKVRRRKPSPETIDAATGEIIEPEPAKTAPAAKPTSYAKLAETLLSATDAEQGMRILDQATDLPADQQGDLANIFETRFGAPGPAKAD